MKKGFKFWIRKKAIALKRNYYTVPLIFVFVCCLQFLCSLFIFSPAFSRLDVNFSSVNSANVVANGLPDFLKGIFNALWPYNCIFLFLITLFTILYSVAYLQYSLNKYGEKRPVHMLIIFFVLWAINILLLLFVYKSNQINLYDEYLAQLEKPSDLIIQQYITYAQQTEALLLTHIILSVITGVVVATAPFVQKALKKLSFNEVKLNEDSTVQDEEK